MARVLTGQIPERMQLPVHRQAQPDLELTMITPKAEQVPVQGRKFTNKKSD
jgi:hypothetical protein